MPKKLFAGLAAAALIALIALMAASAQAAEKAAEDKAAADAAKLGLPVVSYYPLAPEIVTNYTASPRHIKKMSDKTAAAVNDYAKRSLVKDFIVDNLIYQESR